MEKIDDLAREFLSQQRIAVAGISRSGNDAGTMIFRKLKETGHTVFPVNPQAREIDGESCYPTLDAIPGGVDGVVAVTTPEATEAIAWQCVDAGIRWLWMHRSLGNSVSGNAVALCRERGISVIPGGCPMMYQEPVDFGHRCLKWWFRMTGSLPQESG